MSNPPDPRNYDRVLVAFSGGKDCTAIIAVLLERGVDPARIELHHHDVDGGGPAFMDWACTASYCRAVAAALDLPLYRSWREGGFWREMHRQDAPTAPVWFETPEGQLGRAGGQSSSLGTRRRFPQVTANLRQRWCSAALKIDVMDALIRNQPRFYDGRTLVCTGERAEESAARRAYPAFETHRADLRSGRRARHVDHWRPVHSWSEQRVWDAVRDLRLNPHVAYQLGWSRCSCQTCIFGSASAWRTLQLLFPDRFERLVACESAFGCTLRHGAGLREVASRGAVLAAALDRPDLVQQAAQTEWLLPVRLSATDWRLPPGAFQHSGGPS